MTVKAIIPCSGFGTRMGMKSHEAKEMLKDPITGENLIDYSLNLCYDNNIKPIVITRPEKNTLIDYLRDLHGSDLDIIISNPGKEWAETVLQSRGLWGDYNLLLLPDTRFSNHEVIPKLINDLVWNHITEVVVAAHEIDANDVSKWGAITHNAIYEKCNEDEVKSNAAWGILGFKKEIGYDLFSSLKPKGSFYNDGNNLIIHKLDWFKDITRSGKLEKY